MKRKLLLFLLLFQCAFAFAARLDTLTVQSAAMNKSIPNLVILPENYGAQNQSFSVLYLLHGATANYGSWLNDCPNLTDFADNYNMIIVCPDGGYTSWYFDSPVDPAYQYETYVSKELVTAVDAAYNTIPNKYRRAIAGLSMGGHGALYLAFRHQDTWGAAGSMCGGVDFRPFPNNWDLDKRLGVYSEYPENWEKHTVINMVHLLNGKGLKLIIDCGTEDFFYDGNRRLHETLLERRIPHDYIERPGRHNSDYWCNALTYQLLFFNTFFESK